MPRNRMVARSRLLVSILVVPLLLYLAWFLLSPRKGTIANFDSIALKFYLEQLHGPSVSPINQSYSLDHAFTFTLSGEPAWTEHLKERICIIDLHNGTFTEAGEAFDPAGMSWQRTVTSRFEGISLGMLNHWIYARIHGYKYYHISIEESHDRRMSWKKPSILASILQHHDVCVYIDTDATFARLDLPLEWLLNYWQIDPKAHSMALATDPQKAGNIDEMGNVFHNTGFIVLRKSPRTFEILKQWAKCPDDGEPYPGCTRFRTRKFYRLDKARKNLIITGTDQAGFGNYVRYDYPESIATLNCSEANGFPQSGSECDGTFVRHFWTGKHTHIKVEMARQAPGRYLELLNAQYRREREDFWIEEATLAKRGS
ncbi:Putative nucleotide-diphospho-sugar transferase, glycosyltransferase 34 [Septoria linicola]|uniref:Nucleotide-diphospho-sugar transferase, glycosyltransferase 34 n=1 Tax=Septoria linicola TaxID=215465 RepID=A0A9Q9AF82_9PEZI|nr:Putative nucleotide-diphospho-sugar transferase, glycosyltransferase 34 [Septoria linicola]